MAFQPPPAPATCPLLGPICQRGFSPLGLAMQGLEGARPVAPSPVGGLGMEPLLIEAARHILAPVLATSVCPIAATVVSTGAGFR